MKRTQLLAAGFMLGIAWLANTQALAQATNQPPKAGQSQLSSKDTRFLHRAAHVNMLDEQMGQLAATNSSSTQIKQFAQKLVQDHSNANQQLKNIAQNKGAALPMQLERKGERTVEQLSKLTGAEFDRAFLRDAIREHQRAVHEFKLEATRLENPELKQYAATQVPILEEHLNRAQSLESQARAPVVNEPAGKAYRGGRAQP